MSGQPGAGPVPVTWLDEEDVAALLRTPEATVRSWRHRRIGPVFHRIGRRVLYSARDVDAFIATGRTETSGTVLAPGPERPPVRRPGTVTTVVGTASTGIPGVPASGDVSDALNNDGCEDDA